MKRTLKKLGVAVGALLVVLALGGTANAGRLHVDLGVTVPVPFGYATIHTDPLQHYPRYYSPYYYAPYPYYSPYYGPVFRGSYWPAYRHYRYERHVHRGGHDRWRHHDGGRWRHR